LARQRKLQLSVTAQEHHPAVTTDPALTACLAEAIAAAGQTPHRLTSGAGHDAGIMAAIAPTAMLFLRSPGGVSHHPEERVLGDDVAVGLQVLIHYINLLAGRAAAFAGPSSVVHKGKKV
jgi:allantoate deiminase